MQARDAPGGRQRRRREERKKAPTPERPPKALEVKPPRPPSPPGAHASAATPPHPLPSRATRAPLSCSALALAPRTPAGERWEAATARDHPAGEGPRLTSPTKTDTTPHTPPPPRRLSTAATDRPSVTVGDSRGRERRGEKRTGGGGRGGRPAGEGGKGRGTPVSGARGADRHRPRLNFGRRRAPGRGSLRANSHPRDTSPRRWHRGGGRLIVKRRSDRRSPGRNPGPQVRSKCR